jgi:hypothetical protein
VNFSFQNFRVLISGYSLDKDRGKILIVNKYNYSYFKIIGVHNGHSMFSGTQAYSFNAFRNYFGAIQRWVHMQNTGEDVICSIADLDSITLLKVSNIFIIHNLESRYCIHIGL